MSPHRLLLVLACAAGCTSPRPVQPPTPPPSAPARIPPGCEALLTGTWLHATVPGWRYEATDDGTTVRMQVFPPPSVAGEGSTVELRRTPDGFVGQAESLVATPGGPPCRARFDAELLACEPGALVLRSVASASVDARCRMPTGELPGPLLQHRLVRPSAAPDAGPASR
jgi:hypothetical protein